MPYSKKSNSQKKRELREATRRREWHEANDPKEDVAPSSKRNWKLHKGKKYIRVDISKFDDTI